MPRDEFRRRRDPGAFVNSWYASSRTTSMLPGTRARNFLELASSNHVPVGLFGFAR